MHRAKPDLVVATGTTVTLDGLLAGNRPDHPLPVRTALPARPARPTHRRRCDSATWEVATRHNHGSTRSRHTVPRGTPRPSPGRYEVRDVDVELGETLVEGGQPARAGTGELREVGVGYLPMAEHASQHHVGERDLIRPELVP